MARTIAKDHDEKRARILEVAAGVFADRGVARTSMAQVAKDCGISKAAIYHYYPSKDALLFDILETYLRRLRDRLASIPVEGGVAEERLRAFLREILHAYQGMDNLHKIQIEGVPLLSEDRQTVLKAYQRDVVRQLGSIVARIAPAGIDAEPGTRRAVTMSVFGMVNWFYMWNRNADTEARSAYADLVARLTVEGVRGL